MALGFPEIMAELRQERGLSQRKAAADLNISQALLSHYEKGKREPGLSFVRRVCRYYGVSADYILGMEDRGGESAGGRAELAALVGELRALADRAEKTLKETHS